MTSSGVVLTIVDVGVALAGLLSAVELYKVLQSRRQDAHGTEPFQAGLRHTPVRVKRAKRRDAGRAL